MKKKELRAELERCAALYRDQYNALREARAELASERGLRVDYERAADQLARDNATLREDIARAESRALDLVAERDEIAAQARDAMAHTESKVAAKERDYQSACRAEMAATDAMHAAQRESNERARRINTLVHEQEHADRLIARLAQERDQFARDVNALCGEVALERELAEIGAAHERTAYEANAVLSERLTQTRGELERALCDAGNLRAELQTAWKEMDALRARAEVLETMHGLGVN